MVVRSSVKTKTFRYDFNDQGGAIGVINTGIFMPPSATPLQQMANNISVMASGGAANIAFGYASQPEAWQFLSLFSGYDEGAFLNGLATPSFAFTSVAAGGEEIIMTIAAFALTGGSFDIAFWYNEWQR